MKFEEFEVYAGSGNVIPVYEKIVADLETPVSVLARFCNDENLFLLESVEAGERFGRYSFIGVNPRKIFEVKKGGSIMDLRREFADLKPVVLPELPPLTGGAVGYMDYETVNEFEVLPPPKQSGNPVTSRFMICDQMIVFDNLKHSLYIIISVKTDDYENLHSAYDDAQKKIAAIRGRLAQSPVIPEIKSNISKLTANISHDGFINMVEKAKKYIYDGEIIQVVLSQKFIASSYLPTLQIYRALRMVNPSPYTFFMKIGTKTLIGSSPETLVRLTDRKIFLRPIAGSRPRGRDEAADRNMSNELLADPKERAEHLMLVDLARNDAGRVATAGSVQVKDFMTVERYSHIMHLVSTVEGVLDKQYDAFDLLKATFPAGTLSGAPKIRAMEIINELEAESRGFYGGAVGYFSFTGNMDLAITIRTMEIEHGVLILQSGAGIVFDSNAESEYVETLNKGKALLEAVKKAVEKLK